MSLFEGSHGMGNSEVELDESIATLEAGPLLVSPGVATTLVEHWRNTLRATEREDLNELATLLDALRDELASERLDAGAIGDLLLRLGEGTTASAENAADERLSHRLEKLGTLLVRAGNMLSYGKSDTDPTLDQTTSDSARRDNSSGHPDDYSDPHPDQFEDAADDGTSRGAGNTSS
jgi:hypothetical protein